MKPEDLINWNSLSLIRSGNRSTIRSSYKNGKHKVAVFGLKRLVAFWIKWQKNI